MQTWRRQFHVAGMNLLYSLCLKGQILLADERKGGVAEPSVFNFELKHTANIWHLKSCGVQAVAIMQECLPNVRTHHGKLELDTSLQWQPLLPSPFIDLKRRLQVISNSIDGGRRRRRRRRRRRWV
jgi:hypothetical protein